MKPPESQPKIPKDKSQEARESTRWRQRLLLILLPIALTVGGVTILWRLLARENNLFPRTTVGQSAVSVKLAEVETGNITENSEFIASLQSLQSQSLQAKTQGKVSQILVKQGSQVQAQAPLLQIQSSNQLKPTQASGNSNNSNLALQDTQQKLQKARIQLQELAAQRVSKQENVRLNRVNYEKYANLAAQGAISKQSQDEYAQKLELAQADFNNLNARIEAQQVIISKLENAVKQTQASTVNNIQQPQTPQQQQYTINAPFKGTVANILVKVGDVVKPSTRVATVTQNQPLEVDIPVSLEKKALLRKGMLVELIDSKGEKIGIGKVFFISPEVNSTTRTVLVKALFDNTQGKMEAGQFTKTRINWNQNSGVLIPTQAVFRIAGKTFVYVAQKLDSTADSTFVAKQKQVKLGQIVDNKYQIVKGLQPGEKVVISKLLDIEDGKILTNR